MKTKNIYKHFITAFLLGVLIFIVFQIISYLSSDYVFNWENFKTNLAYNQLYSIVLYMSNYFFLSYLLRKYESKLFQPKILSLGILGGAIITVVCLFSLHLFDSLLIEGNTFQQFINNEKLSYYTISFIISMVIIVVFYGIFFYKHIQENKVKEQKIIAGTVSAKFDALKNQLDPHFLFNSLNVLTSLIEENPEAATKFTTSLSKVYRYVLEQKNKDLVPVEEELKFAKLYMSLLTMRFEDSLVFNIPETVTNLDAKVVPLSLQLVLENAVKHNQVTPTKKLTITIKEEEGNLIIKNNLQEKEVLRKSTGVGLKNIQQRYQLLTDRPVHFIKSEDQFSVSIPLLTKRINNMEAQSQYISEKKYLRAKEKLDKIKSFYIHLTIYLIMTPFFLYLNYKSGGFPWALFPILGWGMGILGHASEAFGYNPIFGKNWERNKIKKYMNDEEEFSKFK
ncbi:MAG: 2TM domain-containing protein [Flavobacteriales bacterium]